MGADSESNCGKVEEKHFSYLLIKKSKLKASLFVSCNSNLSRNIKPNVTFEGEKVSCEILHHTSKIDQNQS